MAKRARFYIQKIEPSGCHRCDAIATHYVMDDLNYARDNRADKSPYCRDCAKLIAADHNGKENIK
jgi:hypothetical protein